MVRGPDVLLATSVPQPCRSAQSACQLAVRPIEATGVVLFEHPR